MREKEKSTVTPKKERVEGKESWEHMVAFVAMETAQVGVWRR